MRHRPPEVVRGLTLAGFAALVAALLAGCALSRVPAGPARTPTKAGSPSSAETGSNAPDEPPAELGEPLPPAWPPRLEALPVPGFGDAVVSVPSGEGPLPVLLAAHGAGDSAEWQCAFWQGVVEHRGFVLCPRGKRLSSRDESGYYYENHLALEREVDASLAALEQKEGKRARTTTVTYVGYSQGATMGALMARAHPDRFRRLALIEGGYAEYSAPVARAFARGGAERVLFVCGIKTCRDKARRSGLWLEQAGLLVRLEYVEGGGHTYLGTVGDRARSAFEWLIDGDPLWAKSGT